MLAILLFSRTTFAEPTAASGAPPDAKSAEAKTAQALVSRELIQPLAAKESTRSKFSRASLPAQARRVRILDDQPQQDARGNAFVRFAVDAHHGFTADDDESRWQLATITGCAYLDRSQVFVKRGDEYRPAAFLLGKNLKAAAETTCQPAQAQVAHKD
ncbi:MAG TPA: hypothetical protein VF516_16825 [Kofleriaceae bacterium]